MNNFHTSKSKKMTNEQLIKKAQEAMAGLLGFGDGELPNHELSAYVSLVHLSKRLKKIQKVEAIIEQAYNYALENIEAGEPLDEAEYAKCHGVLLTNRQVIDIYHAIFGTVKNL